MIDERNESSITEGQPIAWFPVLCFHKTSFRRAVLISIVSTMTNPAYTTEQLVYCLAFHSETGFKIGLCEPHLVRREINNKRVSTIVPIVAETLALYNKNVD